LASSLVSASNFYTTIVALALRTSEAKNHLTILRQNAF